MLYGTAGTPTTVLKSATQHAHTNPHPRRWIAPTTCVRLVTPQVRPGIHDLRGVIMAAVDMTKGLAGEPARTVELVANRRSPWYVHNGTARPPWRLLRCG